MFSVKRRWLIALYGFPMIVFIGAIIPFALNDFDLEISSLLYNEKAQLWTFSEAFPIKYQTSGLSANSKDVLIETITFKFTSYKAKQINQ